MPTTPLACWSCGELITADTPSCPRCGAPSKGRVGGVRDITGGRQAAGAKERSVTKKALPWLVLVLGLGALGSIAALFAPDVEQGAPAVSAPRMAPTAPASFASAHPLDELGLDDVRAVDPMDLLGHVKPRAIAWHGDAVLVSIDAEPVRKGFVDLTSGGTVAFVFGRSNDALDPASLVAPERLVVRVDAAGTTVRKTQGGNARSASEPNCTLEEAYESARAAGLPEDGDHAARYEMSTRHGRAVWRLKTRADPKAGRTLDGRTCAVLVQ